MELMVVGENKLKNEAESALRIQQENPESTLLIDREYLDGKRVSMDAEALEADDLACSFFLGILFLIQDKQR